jgi:predicted nucleic acid-binding protein
MIVIADSGPLRYLIVIEHIHLLPMLYGRILFPPGVASELTQAATPEPVRIWLNHLPEWAAIQSPQSSASAFPSALGLGEREAIALAEEVGADVLLVDDEAARIEAGRRLIPVQGTLGVLDLAAEHGCSPICRMPSSD